VLQDPRAVAEMIATGRQTSNEARFEIAKSLLFFADPEAQEAAEELMTETMKNSLEVTPREVKEKGVKALLPW
jgi:hypothetical protein